MRRSLRGLTIPAGVIALTLAMISPALADGDDPVSVGESGGRSDQSTVTVEVESPGKPAAKKPGRTPVDRADSAPMNSGSTSVEPKQRTDVGNYSSGSPESVSSESSGPGLDPTKPIYYDGSGATNAQRAPGPGEKIAFIDGGDPPPAEPEEPAADEPAPEEPAAEEPAEPQVDPAVLAETAVSQIGLEAPSIASTPNNSDVLGAVGLPVWFWVDDPGPTTTGPQETTASAGDVSVTARAEFSGLTITTGDGTTVECSGPGTEYPGTGIDPSPDCGHVYEQMSDDQPGEVYQVGVTAHWAVTWEANTGETGTAEVQLQTGKELRIGSYQTVVTDVS